MPKAGDIKYCDLLGGRKTNAAFVYVPPSAFWMGDASVEDNPVHLVGVSRGFWLQQTPLTEEQYKYLTNINTSGFLRYKLPKTEISWTDVDSMISDKPLRMPTEAEWEFAARAGVGHKYLYSGSNDSHHVAYSYENVMDEKQAVAKLKSNKFGLYDLSGNVDEWCSDWYDWKFRLASAPQLDPQGPASESFRSHRGGSWDSDPKWARVATCGDKKPDDRTSHLGVRLVWEI